MNLRNSFKWSLLIGLALGALAASPAQGGVRPNVRAAVPGAGARQAAADASDVVSRYLRRRATSSRLAGGAGSRGVDGADALVPDVLERYAAAHPYGAGLTVSTSVGSTGFHWGDYGAGVGTGVGLFFALVGGLIATPLRRRHRTQPAVGRG